MRIEMRVKKWLLIGVVVAVLVTSRIYEIADYLQRYDLVWSARDFERTYLTGTTVAVLVTMFVLLRDNGNHRPG